MMDAVRQWAFSLCAAAMACAVIELLLPSISLAKMTRLALSVFFLCVLIQPLGLEAHRSEISLKTGQGMEQAEEYAAEISGRIGEDLSGSVRSAVEEELALIGLLLALMIVHRRFAMAIKWAVGYCALVVFQQFILPVSPMIIATSFTIFATYTRRMFPCLMTGAFMLACTPLRYLIVALRQLHIPQKLIVAISVTLRYFPAIREEIGYIRDAMKLRNIRGLDRLECTVMPLMVSATETAEELSAAAVTRGIENPARKTSAVSLRMPAADCIGMLAVFILLVLSYVVQ